MQELKKIDIMSLAKIQAFIGFVLGLLLGLLMQFTSRMPMVQQQAGMMQGPFGMSAIIWLPIGYAVSGFLMGLVVGLLYNLFASKFGGIKLELK